MLKRLALVLALAMALPGCAAIARIASVVAEAITEYGPILDVIASAADDYFDANPDADRASYAKAMAKARLALSATMHAARGATESTDQDVDAAFEEFRKAYQDVLAILGPLGVASPSTKHVLTVGPAGVVHVPPPESLTLRR